MDLGLTTFFFLIINCLLMILGIVKIMISLILIYVSIFTFSHLKEASFGAYISNAIIYSLNEIAVFVLGILAGNKNNVRFLNTYQVFIVLLIVSKLFSLHHLNQMEDRLKQDLNLSLSDAMYDQRAKVTTSSKADDIQRNLQCCGTDGPGFWTKKEANFSIPRSCCPEKIETVCDASNAYQDGCLDKIIVILPNTLLKIYRYLMIPVIEIILFIVGLVLIIMIVRTSSNSLA